MKARCGFCGQVHEITEVAVFDSYIPLMICEDRPESYHDK